MGLEIQYTHQLTIWYANCSSLNSYKVIDSSFPSSNNTFVLLTSIIRPIGLILYTSRSRTKILDNECFEIQYDDIYQQGIYKAPRKFPIALYSCYLCVSELSLGYVSRTAGPGSSLKTSAFSSRV